LDRHVLTLDVAGLFQALTERGRVRRIPLERRAIEESDDRGPRLLHLRRKRPSRRATEQGYQLAPSDVGHGLPLGTRWSGLPHVKVAAEDTAGPWDEPESF